MEIKKVIEHVLTDLNKKGKTALLVGGFSRDYLLNNKIIKDIDIEVYNATIEWLESFLRIYGDVDITGKSFGVIKFTPFDAIAKIINDIDDGMKGPGIILTIGISGCGKTTFRRKVMERNNNVIVVCPDDIRKDLTGNINDQSRNNEVFDIAKRNAANAIRDGKLVFFDATNVNTRLRNMLIGEIFMIAGISCEIYYKIFECDPNLSKERIKNAIINNENRANVPFDVIDRQYNMYLESIKIIKTAQNLKEPYDFSIPRRENRIGKGHKEFNVELDPSISIKEAASRRDFTINSIAIDPITGKIYDYFNGIKDMKDKIIRHISDKFVEDPLRILRAMQFQARFGFEIANETYELMRQMIDTGELDNIARERIAAEWIKWAEKGIYHDKIFEFLSKTNYGKKYFPELMALRTTKQDPIHHPEGSVEEHTKLALKSMNEIIIRENVDSYWKRILIFATLLHDIAKPMVTKEEWSEKDQRIKITSKNHESLGGEMVTDILARIGLSKDEISIISFLVSNHVVHSNILAIENENSRKSAINELVSKMNNLKPEYLIYLMEADISGRLYSNDYMERRKEKIRVFSRYIFDHIRNYGQKRIPPIIDGSDLIKLGFIPGPIFRIILEDVYEKQLLGEIADYQSAINYINEKYRNHKEEMGVV